MSDRGDTDLLAGFGQMMSAIGGGGDRGNTFPRSDANDLGNGARFIPGEVTLARREGKVVKFVQECSPCCWYWQFSDGAREYHWEPMTHDGIGTYNHGAAWASSSNEHGGHDLASGPCPNCGNEHTNGGPVEADPERPYAPEVTNTTTANMVDATGGLKLPPDVAIPAMERRGQQELVNSAQLPIEGSDNAQILAMGITFGDPTPGDGLFREATLPEGWKKEGSDHDMWSYVVDAEGNGRIAVFYKAAFYDRRAFMRPE